jgi:hypothetical protein
MATAGLQMQVNLISSVCEVEELAARYVGKKAS